MSQFKCNRQEKPSVLIREEAGIHVSISRDLTEAARHSASILTEKYLLWLERDRFSDWGGYKRNRFTIAVGGGNTVKAQYKAWLDHCHRDINWIKHVRFFLLEASSGDENWESAETSLISNFIVPLVQKLIKSKGINTVANSLAMDLPVDVDDVIDEAVARMISSINMAEVERALHDNKQALALKLAEAESERYQRHIQDRLGASMAFHFIVSGIGKDGAIGAFAPYTPELKIKEAGAVVLKPGKGVLRIALNRGVMINAGYIFLIVSGNLKLKALGRFEMEETAELEQTVMETPLRMLRETEEIAEKVYIFADEQALHFDETVFEYSENGVIMKNKAEARAGAEDNGVHILLMHGLLGLFSFTNLLIRLPSAWRVSALHRGSHAKTLDNDEIFPYYARALRKAILKNWRKGRPVPIAAHSIGGVIIDHLLLSIIDDYDGPIPSYGDLKPENKQLVDALRASGIISLATWAPSDGLNAGTNIKNLVSHYRTDSELDYTGLDPIYITGADGKLQPADEDAIVESNKQLSGLNKFLGRRRLSKGIIDALNLGIRHLLNLRAVRYKMLNSDNPYVIRIVNGRLLKKVSFYGLIKEINASQHHPLEYQHRHLKALEIILQYDFPTLNIIHRDDLAPGERGCQAGGRSTDSSPARAVTARAGGTAHGSFEPAPDGHVHLQRGQPHRPGSHGGDDRVCQ
jgi:6-phosphogluconolactonase/glucosamine-6-phosphate isomerase/deaminase